MRQLWIVVAACSSSPNHAAPDAAPLVDGAPDAPADAAPLDPWTAPLGSALSGVTLSDGWTDLRALPASMLIDGGWTDSLFATPDGLHLRFAYQPLDFFDFFISNGSASMITGPELAGDPAQAFQMFDATLTGSGWTIVADPVDSTSIEMASPASNASDDLLVFTEFVANAPSRLYYASLASNIWSAPAAVTIGSGAANDDNAKIYGELATSVAIYFESNRGSGGQRTLFTTTYTAATDSFAPVTQLPGIATGSSDDTQPFLTADQQTIYFTSSRGAQYGVFTATRQSDGSWADVHAIASPTTAPTMYAGNVTLLGEASVVVTPEGELLYMMCGLAEDRPGSASYGNANYVALEPCVARRPM
jgi:hypothetical protein